MLDHHFEAKALENAGDGHALVHKAELLVCISCHVSVLFAGRDSLHERGIRASHGNRVAWMARALLKEGFAHQRECYRAHVVVCALAVGNHERHNVVHDLARKPLKVYYFF